MTKLDDARAAYAQAKEDLMEIDRQISEVSDRERALLLEREELLGSLPGLEKLREQRERAVNAAQGEVTRLEVAEADAEEEVAETE